MSRYVKFFPKLWNNRSIRSLPEDGRNLYLYLCTCPHGNMAGLYHLPLGYGALDLQWTVERVEKALQTCEEAHLVKYDPLENLLLVLHYLQYNALENVNQAKGAAKCLEELPPTPLLADFKACVKQYAPSFLYPFETLWKGFTEPETVTETITKKEEITIKETEKEKINLPVPPDNDSEQKDNDFDQFWAYYPRPIGRKKTAAAWQKRLQENVSPQDLINAAKHYALYCRKMQTQPCFIKHPANFLGSDRGFEDYINGPPENICSGPPGWHHLQEMYARYREEELRDETIGNG